MEEYRRRHRIPRLRSTVPLLAEAPFYAAPESLSPGVIWSSVRRKKGYGIALWKAFHKRKNWLFFGYADAGERSAVISVVETCRRLKIPVRDYLGSVLPGLGDFPVGRIAELTPAAWAARN